MALTSLLNDRGQSIDTLWGADGVTRIKLGIGAKDVAGQTVDGAWHGIATHADGATFATGDGVAVAAGVESGADGVVPLLVDTAGRLQVSLVPSTGNLADQSGTITAGTTSQELAASNLSRKYLLVQNLDDAEDLWIDFGTAAVLDTPSIRIVPKAIWEMKDSFICTQAVNVNATTTGHKFTAKEG